MKPLVMHASNASRWNDSTKASASAVANDAPCCTMHVPAVICKRMLEVEVRPSPGWLMPLETQTLGCKAIKVSAPRGSSTNA